MKDSLDSFVQGATFGFGAALALIATAYVVVSLTDLIDRNRGGKQA